MRINDSKYIGIDDNRLRHMYEVGRVCEKLALTVFGLDEAQSRQMFLLGFMHDIGYEYSETQIMHETVGGALLENAGFIHADAIRMHGDPHVESMPVTLLILNIADMSVSNIGERVSFETRLSGIAGRYGTDSIQFVKAERLVRAIERELNLLGSNLAEIFGKIE